MKIILLLLIANFVFPLGERIQPKKYIFERSDQIKMKNVKYWKKNNNIWETVSYMTFDSFTKFVPSLTETAEEIKDIYILYTNSTYNPETYILSDRFNPFDKTLSIDTSINKILSFELERTSLEAMIVSRDKDKKILEKINIAFNDKYRSNVHLTSNENLYLYYYIYNNRDGHKMVQFMRRSAETSEEKLIELFNEKYYEAPFKDFINYIDELMNNKLFIEDSNIDNLDFMDTDIEGFDSWSAPPSKKKSNNTKFVAYDSAPKPKKPLVPRYPEICRAAGIEGKVTVEFYVYEKLKFIHQRL